MLNDQSFIRYQRQVSIPEIGENGQKALLNSHVLMIGCGGLGSAASLYLAAAGVGKLVIVDDDIVDSSNLQRQVVYREEDIGTDKVVSMAKNLSAINNYCQVRKINHRMSAIELSLEVMLADLVLDCSDNFKTRQLINAACYIQQTPLVSASAIGWKGQFMVFDFPNQKSCYRCLFPFDELNVPSRCTDSGVVGPVVGVMGNMQALAAIQKLTTGKFCHNTNDMRLFDGRLMTWQYIAMAKDRCCEVCSKPLLDNKSANNIAKSEVVTK